MMWGQKIHDCELAGHQFEARYDQEPGRFRSGEGSIDMAALKLLVEASIKKTYVHDICVKCGKIVKR